MWLSSRLRSHQQSIRSIEREYSRTQRSTPTQSRDYHRTLIKTSTPATLQDSQKKGTAKRVAVSQAHSSDSIKMSSPSNQSDASTLSEVDATHFDCPSTSSTPATFSNSSSRYKIEHLNSPTPKTEQQTQMKQQNKKGSKQPTPTNKMTIAKKYNTQVSERPSRTVPPSRTPKVPALSRSIQSKIPSALSTPRGKRISSAGCKNALSRRPVQERPISAPGPRTTYLGARLKNDLSRRPIEERPISAPDPRTTYLKRDYGFSDFVVAVLRDFKIRLL